MSDVTQILSKIESGDPRASDELLPLVYDELRKLAAAKLANEKPGQTLQATALVHDAYIRLVDVEQAQHWDSRGHFFAAAAQAMRRILINRAIQKKTVKHGGDRKRIELDEVLIAEDKQPERILLLDEALQRLEQIDERKGKIVMLRYFAGLSIEETSQALEISPATVKREWQFARTWLQKEMNKSAL